MSNTLPLKRMRDNEGQMYSEKSPGEETQFSKSKMWGTFQRPANADLIRELESKPWSWISGRSNENRVIQRRSDVNEDLEASRIKLMNHYHNQYSGKAENKIDETSLEN